jgi:hypothetical protein
MENQLEILVDEFSDGVDSLQEKVDEALKEMESLKLCIKSCKDILHIPEDKKWHDAWVEELKILQEFVYRSTGVNHE